VKPHLWIDTAITCWLVGPVAHIRCSYTRVYPKVSGLSRWQNKQQQKPVEKQRKGLWRQNSLDWLTKYRYNCTYL